VIKYANVKTASFCIIQECCGKLVLELILPTPFVNAFSGVYVDGFVNWIGVLADVSLYTAFPKNTFIPILFPLPLSQEGVSANIQIVELQVNRALQPRAGGIASATGLRVLLSGVYKFSSFFTPIFCDARGVVLQLIRQKTAPDGNLCDLLASDSGSVVARSLTSSAITLVGEPEIVQSVTVPASFDRITETEALGIGRTLSPFKYVQASEGDIFYLRFFNQGDSVVGSLKLSGYDNCTNASFSVSRKDDIPLLG